MSPEARLFIVIYCKMCVFIFLFMPSFGIWDAYGVQPKTFWFFYETETGIWRLAGGRTVITTGLFRFSSYHFCLPHSSRSQATAAPLLVVLPSCWPLRTWFQIWNFNLLNSAVLRWGNHLFWQYHAKEHDKCSRSNRWWYLSAIWIGAMIMIVLE